jgi:predicted membrane protein
MKALHFLRWPLILLLLGYLAFLVGNVSKSRHWAPANEFIITGYLMIIIAIVWTIIKFIFLKPPEEDIDR